MSASIDEVLATLNEFRQENANAHGRIEERQRASTADQLELEEKVDELVVDAAVAKSIGARAGRKWGAGVGAALIVTAEAVRAWIFGP